MPINLNDPFMDNRVRFERSKDTETDLDIWLTRNLMGLEMQQIVAFKKIDEILGFRERRPLEQRDVVPKTHQTMVRFGTGSGAWYGDWMRTVRNIYAYGSTEAPEEAPTAEWVESWDVTEVIRAQNEANYWAKKRLEHNDWGDPGEEWDY